GGTGNPLLARNSASAAGTPISIATLGPSSCRLASLPVGSRASETCTEQPLCEGGNLVRRIGRKNLADQHRGIPESLDSVAVGQLQRRERSDQLSALDPRV